jgi:alpha-glucosidase (family GH31 glycosyl hydrolase)
MYEEMARACGIDPSTKERVKFDILSRDFMEKYFDILHHPYEEAGVNFWWMDWQQGRDFWWIHAPNKNGNLQDPREVVHPLWFLNHLHIADIKRNGLRPMFFSRYSGPGSHRYPVGFSGDTMITWEALDFQPYFTLTASNVGYS